MNMRDVKELGARLASAGKGKPQIRVDSAAIRELAALLEETGLAEIEIGEGDRRIRVARESLSSRLQPTIPIPMLSEPVDGPQSQRPPSPAKHQSDGHAVTSPMVGTVYTAPEPGKPPFVKKGDSVREGDTLLIVEAMKTMNPIAAPRSGFVQEICVQDGQPVEFGQTLIVLAPEQA
ncbi:MAG TPA: acetyl-CoA carboxylase biotin carboxyl carrier protein [Rhizomicrobium sp.]|jgi:acetyl-CoA carboxylase biotin carboxyl carrier protein|nr:acetyl-CoA carboxylase biotin carboxyl carrier protein [Rhizomicrobium sp.]